LGLFAERFPEVIINIINIITVQSSFHIFEIYILILNLYFIFVFYFLLELQMMFDKASQLSMIFIDVLAGRAYTSKTGSFCFVHINNKCLSIDVLIFEIERIVIAGTLDGLGSLLVHFSGDFVADPKNVKMLYKFVCIALTPDPTSGRYDIRKS
jgi:hypothetical protein